MRRFRLTAGVVALLGLMVGMAAAQSQSGDFNWKQFSGQSIKVYVADTGQLKYLKPKLQDFEDLTGIKVSIEAADVTSYRSNLPIRLTTRSSDFDVMATFPSVDGLQFSSNGWYEPLSKYINDPKLTNPNYDYQDFPSGAQKSMEVNGKTVTILWEMQTDLVYYRKDLLQKAGLSVPTTFQEWVDAARKIQDPGNGLYGLALRGIPYQTTTPYSAFLTGYCGNWLDKSGNADINSKSAMDAWMMYGEWGKYGPPGITGFDWPVPAQQFEQGRVFAFLDINLFVPDMQDPQKSKVVGDVGYAPVPAGPCGRHPFIGGWGYGVNPFSRHKDAAWYFIQWATSKKIDLEMKLAGWPSPRASAWSSPEFKAQDPTPGFTQVVLKSLEIADADMNPPVAPGVQAREIAGTVGNKALEGVTRAELQKVADEQNKKLQQLIDSSQN